MTLKDLWELLTETWNAWSTHMMRDCSYSWNLVTWYHGERHLENA
jgi:hypothetical protein